MCFARAFGRFSSKISCDGCTPETCKTVKMCVYIWSIHRFFFFFQIISDIRYPRKKRVMKDGVIWKDFLSS